VKNGTEKGKAKDTPAKDSVKVTVHRSFVEMHKRNCCFPKSVLRAEFPEVRRLLQISPLPQRRKAPRRAEFPEVRSILRANAPRRAEFPEVRSILRAAVKRNG